MKTIEEIKASHRVLVGEMGTDGFAGQIFLPLWNGMICA